MAKDLSITIKPRGVWRCPFLARAPLLFHQNPDNHSQETTWSLSDVWRSQNCENIYENNKFRINKPVFV